MIELRRDKEIHHESGGWYEARWHFSFSGYLDPENMGVGALRVFNDDRLVPGAEWPMHRHRDVESNTYVVEGTFAHRDSLGNDGRLQPGAAQVMRFSSEGAMHSELNGSDDEPMRFIQFWILPSEPAAESSVQQRQYTIEDRTDRWLQIMGPRGEDGLDLIQDARALVSRLSEGKTLSRDFSEGRGGYLYVIEGGLRMGDDVLQSGDAAKIYGPERLEVVGEEAAELIAIEVPLDFQPVGVWESRLG
ncbi:MAG: pirin family protein [Actinomycetota bacterium]|nr:pirin family protein [Actinomycetota bacterium]